MAFRRARRQACGLAFVMGRRRRTGGPPWFGSPGPSRHDRLAPWEKPRFEFHGRHEGSVKDSWSFGVRFAGWKPSRFDLRDSFDASGAQLLSWHCSWCNVLVPLDAACSACGCVRPSADPARPRAQPQHQSSPAPWARAGRRAVSLEPMDVDPPAGPSTARCLCGGWLVAQHGSRRRDRRGPRPDPRPIGEASLAPRPGAPVEGGRTRALALLAG